MNLSLRDNRADSQRISRQRKARRGFTLVEMLVVLGVVSVLAAILYPVVIAAREKAQTAECMSNQRQLASAFLSYSVDWDDRLPRWWTPDGGPRKTTLGLRAGQRDWAVDIYPYTQNSQIYTCPLRKLIRGYGFNLWLATGDGISSTDINFVTRTAMFAEILGKAPNPSAFDFVDRSAPENWPMDPRFQFEPRHRGGANIAFTDGHVKWVPSSHYTQWPSDARRNMKASYMGVYAGGTPVGTYWWPNSVSPPG